MRKAQLKFLQVIFASAIALSSYSHAIDFTKNLQPNVLEKAKAEVKKIKVDDVELAYSIRGDGAPLLLIAGFKSTMGIWDPALLELLEKQYQVIVFDNRGVGLSSDTTEDKTTIAQMADDAAGLIEALGFEKAHILGWSMGGAIAESLAIRHGAKVDKVILCSPTPLGAEKILPSEAVVKALTAPEMNEEAFLNILFPNNDDGRILAKAYVERLSEAYKNGWIPDDKNVSKETIVRQTKARQLFTGDNSNFEALGGIKTQVLVVGGLQDVIDPPENVHLVVNKIPFAWCAYMNGGHAFMFQDHERFVNLVFSFLE